MRISLFKARHNFPGWRILQFAVSFNSLSIPLSVSPFLSLEVEFGNGKIRRSSCLIQQLLNDLVDSNPVSHGPVIDDDSVPQNGDGKCLDIARGRNGATFQ